MKFAFTFFLLYFTLNLFVEGAQACQETYARKEDVTGIIRDAIFIGKMKVLELEVDENGYPYKTVLEPIEAYGTFPHKESFNIVAYNSSCSKGFLSQGTIYEEIILPYKGIPGTYTTSRQGQLFPDDVWIELRNQATGDDLRWNEIDSECANKKGAWKIVKKGFSNIYECEVQ